MSISATRALARVSLVHLLIFTTSGCRSELPYRKELHLITSATRALARVSPKRLPKIATLLGGATPQEGAKPFHSFPKNCLFARLRARLSEGATLFNLHPARALARVPGKTFSLFHFPLLFHLHPARALARVPGSPPTCSTHLRNFDQNLLFAGPSKNWKPRFPVSVGTGGAGPCRNWKPRFPVSGRP